jgi:hypothetical protein
MAVDQTNVDELMGALAGHMTGGAVCFSVLLSDELGLYRTMPAAGAMCEDGTVLLVEPFARETPMNFAFEARA